MSHQPDDHDHRRDLDEDAAWREIVANYGDRVTPSDTSVEPVEPTPPDDDAEAGETRRNVFDRSYLESQEPNTEVGYDDEGHFVPPTPPPLPQLSPRRKVAWTGLLGAPTLMLLVIILGWQVPTWAMGLLVAWFVGGFLYLVATMPRSRGDGWSGDDGAVV